MQKITPFLWFDNQAEDAANFYTSIFKNSNVVKVTRYGDTGPGPKGSVMTVVSWQIVPTVLGVMLQHADPERSQRVMNAVLQMKKIDIDVLKKTHGQR